VTQVSVCPEGERLVPIPLACPGQTGSEHKSLSPCGVRWAQEVIKWGAPLALEPPCLGTSAHRALSPV
jgi:hypothetical protein